MHNTVLSFSPIHSDPPCLVFLFASSHFNICYHGDIAIIAPSNGLYHHPPPIVHCIDILNNGQWGLRLPAQFPFYGEYPFLMASLCLTTISFSRICPIH